MPTDHYFLGVDVGGTKTEAVVCNSDGAIVGQGIADGANPHNAPFASTITNIEQAISAASVNLSEPHFAVTCLGIAGLDTENDLDTVRAKLEPSLKTEKMLLHNDGYIGLKSGTDLDYGICLIASTGSNCFGINPSGTQAKAGNWGYLLGDQGSGFSLGLNIIKLAVKEYDGRINPSGLFDLVCRQLAVNNFAELSALIYQPYPPVKIISQLAGMISDPEFARRPEIIALTTDTVNSLFEAFTAVVKKINLAAESSFPVVLVGKLFLATDLITQPLSQRITASYPQSTLIKPEISPAEAAARYALRSYLSKLSP